MPAGPENCCSPVMCWYRSRPGRTDAAQMAAGDEAGAAFARRDVVRIPEELHVERMVGGVGDRVDVERLHVRRARRMWWVQSWSNSGFGPDERLDDAAHLGEPKILTDRRTAAGSTHPVACRRAAASTSSGVEIARPSSCSHLGDGAGRLTSSGTIESNRMNSVGHELPPSVASGQSMVDGCHGSVPRVRRGRGVR